MIHWYFFCCLNCLLSEVSHTCLFNHPIYIRNYLYASSHCQHDNRTEGLRTSRGLTPGHQESVNWPSSSLLDSLPLSTTGIRTWVHGSRWIRTQRLTLSLGEWHRLRRRFDLFCESLITNMDVVRSMNTLHPFDVTSPAFSQSPFAVASVHIRLMT